MDDEAPATITDYLVALAGEIELPAKMRRRVMCEVADHLVDRASDLHAGGLAADAAERAAVEAFGAPAAIALRLAEEHAVASAGRASALTAGAALALCATARSISLTIPVSVLFQVAVVVAAITLARAHRTRRETTVSPSRLRLIARGNWTVLVSIAGVAAFAGGPLAARPPGATGLLALAVLLGFTVTAAAAALRASRRAAAVAPRTVDTAETAVDDLAECLRALLAGSGRVGRLAAGLAGTPVARMLAALDPRRRPWRFAVAVSVSAGASFAAVHGVVEGGPTSIARIPLAIAAGAVIAAIETALALGGYLVLGRFLAIRPSRGRRRKVL